MSSLSACSVPKPQIKVNGRCLYLFNVVFLKPGAEGCYYVENTVMYHNLTSVIKSSVGGGVGLHGSIRLSKLNMLQDSADALFVPA